MAINKTIKLAWEGVEYDIHITMRVIDSIEEELNLMKVVEQCTTGDVRFSHAAKLIAILLRSAGCPVTQEDVFEGIFSEETIEPQEVIQLLWHILEAIFPEPKKKSNTKQLKKKSKATRGKRSTS